MLRSGGGAGHRRTCAGYAKNSLDPRGIQKARHEYRASKPRGGKRNRSGEWPGSVFTTAILSAVEALFFADTRLLHLNVQAPYKTRVKLVS